jgi:DNA-binding MarR family transcriptional regulator
MAKDPEPDDEDMPGAAIAAGLERLSRLMRAEEHSHGLNPAQWEALRYLARANRISNSPGALTRFLGATKGTISQTVKALERKGFITKTARDGEKRSLVLALTPRGEEVLTRDPWARLATATDELGGKTRRRMARALRELLRQEISRGQLASFGSCATCRFYRERGREDDPRGPHLCMLLEQPLSAREAQKICVSHEAA